MIIDRAPLTGLDAYLRTPSDGLNLGGAQGSTATYDVVGEGRVTRLDGIDIIVEDEKLVERLSRDDPGAGFLLKVAVRKEMAPGLFADPYTNRVHLLAGHEDLSRGTLINGRVATVEGAPVLVSVDRTITWSSAIYRFADPIKLSAAAWDIPASRRTPEDAFKYFARLEYWLSGNNTPAPTDTIDLANGFTPDKVRAAEFDLKDITAYRILFKAEVGLDPAFSTFTERADDLPSFGRPLLRSVTLLEPTEPTHEYCAIAELHLAASDVQYFPQDSGALTKMIASLDIPATLGDGEGIALTVAGGAFKSLQARLRATRLERPPITDEAV